MKLSMLKQTLASNPNALIRFQLPDGTLSAAHAHITEVGLVQKSFIDCGGTVRSDESCQLQSWVADDFDHRLLAGKLLSIIELAKSVLGESDLSVVLEHDIGYATQFPLTASELVNDELIIQLGGKHTACLAPEKCCPPQQFVALSRKG